MTNYIIFLISSIILGQFICAVCSVKVACRDEQGNDVDWFYIYKLPKNHKLKAESADNSINKKSTDDHEGSHYMFISSTNPEAWQNSERLINSADSMPALTLNPLFSDASVLLVAYNDEFPNGTVVFDKGHAKGVVATDGVTGIWLVHSVPKFPAIPGYDYPHTGEMYGQSFFCLSMAVSEMDKVGAQLVFNEPNIYYSRVPVVLADKFLSLERAIAGNWRTAAPFSNQLELKSLQGKSFQSFAKGSRYNQDLYEDLVAPALDVNLLVESWRKGAGNMPSNCSKDDKVYNIAGIDGKTLGLDISFHTTSDHSKWAVSEATGVKVFRWRIGGSDWICVGDINRQEHQLLRGGGTVCQKSLRVASLYRKLISDYEPCSKGK